MPFSTKHYSLGAMQNNDVYSASLDKVRFTIIDNQLSALSGFTGEGIITGWGVTSLGGSNGLDLVISPGVGMIDIFVAQSYGNIYYTVDDNASTYLYMQRKINAVSGLSQFSNLTTIIDIDIIPPPVPTNIVPVNWDYNYIKISWDDVSRTVPDFSKYLIYRSSDGFLTSVLAGDSLDNNYTDLAVEQYTTYQYKVSAVDKTGNESSKSASSSGISTAKDLRLPLDVSYFISFAGDTFIDLLWKGPNSSNIDHYEIWLSILDNDFNVIDVIETYSVNKNAEFFQIINIVNDNIYKISIYSVTANGVMSNGADVIDSPHHIVGPTAPNYISLEDEKNDRNEYGVDLKLAWACGNYVGSFSGSNFCVDSKKFVITIIENGSIVSDPIYVYGKYNIVIEIFYVKGIAYPVLPKTDYIAKIEVEDKNKVRSSPIYARIKTSSYTMPASPINISGVLDSNGNLVFTWENQSDNLDYINMQILENNNPIVGWTDIGNTTIYVLEKENVHSETTYIINLQAVDEYENESGVVSNSYITDNFSIVPPIPDGVKAMKGNGDIRISWNAVLSVKAAFYKIWRCDYKVYGRKASDFTLLAKISSAYNSYNDYDIAEGGRYYYFITTVDIYGNESLNPIDNGFFYYPLTFSYVNIDGSFTQPTGLQSSKDGYGVMLEWDLASDAFDGYEIFRSLDGAGWTKINSVDKNQTFYFDENILGNGEDNGNIYYMIRKFRNGCVIIGKSPIDLAPENSILIASVTSSSGETIIDQSVASISGGIVDQFAIEKIAEHKHDIDSLGIDRRIDLRKNAIVSNWITADNIVFTTTEDILSAIRYVPFIIDDNYKIVTIDSVFNVDVDKKTITFIEGIEYSSIYVECVGTEETQKSISNGKVEEISYEQINTGQIQSGIISTINHNGRINENLIPLQIPLTTTDGYRFTILENNFGKTTNIGNAVIFYDAIKLVNWDFININSSYWSSDDFDILSFDSWKEQNLSLVYTDWYNDLFNKDIDYVVVTSNGVYSIYNGVLSSILVTDSVPHKLYICPFLNRYFLLTATSVYSSIDGLKWIKCNGVDGVNFIRDIVNDDMGNIFVSTNAGIYISQDGITFSLTKKVDNFTDNVFAMYKDNGDIIVSTDVGLIKTNDFGETWINTEDLDGDQVYSFFRTKNYIFAITKNSIWRKYYSDLSFVKIYQNNDSFLRKIIIKNDIIYVSSNNGVLISSNEIDIYTDSIILFNNIKDFSKNETYFTATCMRVIGDDCVFGTDNLFVNNDNKTTIYSNALTTPSVYVYNNLVNIGCYLFNSDSSVVFDTDDIDIEDFDIGIVIEYNTFIALNGGWVGNNYLSNINVYKNGILLTSSEATNDLVVDSLSTVVFDTFTELDSNSEQAKAYAYNYSQDLTILINNNNAGIVNLSTYVNNVVNDYYKTYSQVIGKIRYSSTLSVNNIDYVVVAGFITTLDIYNNVFSVFEVVPNIPETVVSFNANITADISSGIFRLYNTNFDKYDTLSIDIINNTLYNSGVNSHDNLDDELEKINSGLPVGLSNIQQENLLKIGLYLEKYLHQDYIEYDNCGFIINEYVNTDIYPLITSDPSITFAEIGNGYTGINYPTSVLYVAEINKVLVGSENGIFAVDSITNSFSFFGLSGNLIKDLKLENSILYVLTNREMYYSDDFGESWKKNRLFGVTGNNIAISFIKNNLMISTSVGGFYYDLDNDVWDKAIEISSISSMYSGNNVASLIVDGVDIYYSTNGISWQVSGNITGYNINCLTGYTTSLLVGTDHGLRSDNASFYSYLPTTSLVDIANDVTISGGLRINDISVFDNGSNANKYVVATSNGDVYILDSGIFTKEITGLSSAHKIIFVDTDVWVFGFDKLKILSKPGLIDLKNI